MPPSNGRDSLARVAENLVDKAVPRPAGSLSGHNSGLPFETLVHDALVEVFPGRAFRHFELLNEVFAAHPHATTHAARQELLGPPALQLLLGRGQKETAAWSPANLFAEKQNDTAESVLLPTSNLSLTGPVNHPVHLVDVKTQQLGKKAQAPNIISAEKMVKACRRILESDNPRVPFVVSYLSIRWEATATELVCREAKAVSLLQVPPTEIYINWAASTQIQFHPDQVSQSFIGTPVEWARAFVKQYCTSLTSRIAKQTAMLEEYQALLAQ